MEITKEIFEAEWPETYYAVRRAWRQYGFYVCLMTRLPYEKQRQSSLPEIRTWIQKGREPSLGYSRKRVKHYWSEEEAKVACTLAQTGVQAEELPDPVEGPKSRVFVYRNGKHGWYHVSKADTSEQLVEAMKEIIGNEAGNPTKSDRIIENKTGFDSKEAIESLPDGSVKEQAMSAYKSYLRDVRDQKDWNTYVDAVQACKSGEALPKGYSLEELFQQVIGDDEWDIHNLE